MWPVRVLLGSVLCTFALVYYAYDSSLLETTKSALHAYASFALPASHCPDPLAPPSVDSVLNPSCEALPPHPELDGAFDVELCLSRAVPNNGWIRIERTDKDACSQADSTLTSTHPEIDSVLRAKGPDFFHVHIEGEQRFAAEVEVEYLGGCVYQYPFRLATAAPVNLSIWWTFRGYRAATESEELALQYDRAPPVIDGNSHLITSVSSDSECPPVNASAAAPDSSLPPCSTTTPTPGLYMKADPSTTANTLWQGYVFQPVGCRWTNPLVYGTPPADVQRGFQARNVLFLGDSHVRYSYDVLMHAYSGDWERYAHHIGAKIEMKSNTFGPTTLDYVWDPILAETLIQLNCSTLDKYDTVVLGGGHHHAMHIPRDPVHAKQFSLTEWSELIEGLARKLGPDACPDQKPPKIVWIGCPARPVQVEPAEHTGHGLLDGRSNWRLRLYDSIAWAHFEKIGAARVDMFALSEPFVNDFQDRLHMRATDSLTALVQEVHQKIAPTEQAYTHSDELSS